MLAAHALVPPPRRIARSPARRAQSAAADAAEKTWRSRRRLARAAFDARCAWDRAAAQAELEREDEEDLDVVQSTVSTTAFGVVLVALVVRFGGRAALLQVLGLDVGADQEIAQRIDEFVVWARSFSVAGFEDFGLLVGYAGAFTVAKVLCLDALTFLLAVSSGVLFGGVVKGALAATACATLGSTVAFGIARYGRPRLREKLLVLVRRDPKTRALERAVVERGFATVLVLRLAPLLPIPIGGYNYLYGATAMDLVQFVPAMFLGSVKPYAFDAYLGVVGKQVVDDVAGGGAAAPGLSDPVIIGVFAAFLAIGALSSELAGQAWREIEEASAGDDDDGEYPDGDWLDVLEARESAPWRAWDGVAAQIAAREPAWSADLRARGRRARARRCGRWRATSWPSRARRTPSCAPRRSCRRARRAPTRRRGGGPSSAPSACRRRRPTPTRSRRRPCRRARSRSSTCSRRSWSRPLLVRRRPRGLRRGVPRRRGRRRRDVTF